MRNGIKFSPIHTQYYGKRFKNIELVPSSTTATTWIVLTIIFFARNVCHINQVNAQETPKYSIDTAYRRRQEMN